MDIEHVAAPQNKASGRSALNSAGDFSGYAEVPVSRRVRRYIDAATGAACRAVCMVAACGLKSGFRAAEHCCGGSWGRENLHLRCIVSIRLEVPSVTPLMELAHVYPFLDVCFNRFAW